MAEPGSHCPVCGQGPLTRLAFDRVRCPAGDVTSAAGWAYLACLDPRPPSATENLGRLDLGEYFAPAHLGLVVEPGFPPLLCCVTQTARQAMEVLRAEWDLRICEPVVIALWSCKAWEQRGAA